MTAHCRPPPGGLSRVPAGRLIGVPAYHEGVPVVAPTPDRHVELNYVAALEKRVGMAKPPTNQRSLRKFFRFVRHWMRSNIKNFVPHDLDLDDPHFFDAWIESRTSYSLARKQELRRALDRLLARRRRDPLQPYFPMTCRRRRPRRTNVARPAQVVMFLKTEFYRAFKAPRGINSRSDEMKVFIGPLISLLESLTYDIPMLRTADGSYAPPDLTSTGMRWFIKHVPVHSRPQAIECLRGFMEPGSRIYATDHTAFESHFTPTIMANCEFELFRYLAHKNPQATARLDTFQHVVCGTTVSDCSWFTAVCEGIRQSGEMTTSLGNGFTNLMLMLYTSHVCGCSAWGMVEGDDALFVITPTVGFAVPSTTEFSVLGWDLKLEVISRLEDASFCGNVYVPGEFQTLSDPAWFLARAPWYLGPQCTSISGSVAIELLRATAMSALAEYHGCPVISTWATTMLASTGTGVFRTSLGHETDYWSEVLLRSCTTAKIQTWMCEMPSDASRISVARNFGFSVPDQLRAEADLRAGLPVNLRCIPADWKNFSRKHLFAH